MKIRTKNFLLIGAIIAISVISTFVIKNGKVVLEQTQSLKSEDIIQIKIKPSNREFKSLTNHEVIISDKKKINSFCQIFNSLEKTATTFKTKPEWAASLEVETIKKTIKFGVRKSGQRIDFQFGSNGESGWQFGYMKSQGFGNTFKSLIKE